MNWLLPLRRIDASRFELTPPNAMVGAYGGFLMAGAVRAAASTIEGADLHSLHATFLRRPQPGAFDVAVEPVRDSRSFATRRLTLSQSEPFFVATLSYNAGGPGEDWQHEPPAPFGDPEDLERFPTAFGELDTLDLRPVNGVERLGHGLPSAPIHPYWAKPVQAIGNDPGCDAVPLAFASDYFVILTAMAPGQQAGPQAFPVTLEHSLWIHRAFDGNDWLRYDATLLTSHAGRALSRGTVHDRAGRLVASFVQECLVRPMPARAG